MVMIEERDEKNNEIGPGEIDELESEINEIDQYLKDKDTQLGHILLLGQEVEQIQNQLQNKYEEGKSFNKPSKIKYGILFFIAITMDLLDALEFTGIAIIVTTIISLLFGFIIFLIFYLTKTKQKKADAYVEGLKSWLDNISKRISIIEKRVYNLSRIIGRSKYIRSLSRGSGRLANLAKKMRIASIASRKFIKKNPISRFIVTWLADLVPLISFLPLNIIGIYLSYRAEKNSFESARKAADDIPQVAEQNISSYLEAANETILEQAA